MAVTVASQRFFKSSPVNTSSSSTLVADPFLNSGGLGTCSNGKGVNVFATLRCVPLGCGCRMLEHQVEEELTTVRVQDPRVQNEGSWNSYVDYKIFLHTNSKAFTAKTSCVRRRYREFVWLRKRLQKNAGLVPVPELPGKSTFFAGSTDEFIEKRRQGLQQFLEKVVQNVVLLSDSQLHLFLQSQLSIPEIEACVQGRGSLSVTDAILHYAMSNCGWVQEEDSHSTLLAKGDFSSSSVESHPHWSDISMEDSQLESPDSEEEEPLPVDSVASADLVKEQCGTEEGAEEQKKQVSSLSSSGGVYIMPQIAAQRRRSLAATGAQREHPLRYCICEFSEMCILAKIKKDNISRRCPFTVLCFLPNLRMFDLTFSLTSSALI
ncbi:sorting nexin-11 isoform X2 [Podarcis lilfordi]|uniref:Sorting nexin-11 isoform X2 n=1 Tax=Podarcis lilfordi TaxID=74358 RepID=A0AA35PMJ7_9SAUR|nr:sorting nexin-11 isoform X2 [Podarcis lilfordi]